MLECCNRGEIPSRVAVLQRTTSSVHSREQPAVVLIDADALLCEVADRASFPTVLWGNDSPALVVSYHSCNPSGYSARVLSCHHRNEYVSMGGRRTFGFPTGDSVTSVAHLHKHSSDFFREGLARSSNEVSRRQIHN